MRWKTQSRTMRVIDHCSKMISWLANPFIKCIIYVKGFSEAYTFLLTFPMCIQISTPSPYIHIISDSLKLLHKISNINPHILSPFP